jgi:COMPASS component SWD1
MLDMGSLRDADACSQEDEEEIAKRKMKAEEEEVEIDFKVEDVAQRNLRPDRSQTEDEDIAWANQDSDRDLGKFGMKIVIQDDSDL